MLYDNIRYYIKKAGLSISEAERRAGLARGHIYRWKKSAPSVTNIKKVADVLGVTVDELIKERD